MSPYHRADVTFSSGDTSCAAWLYQPAPAPPSPGPMVILGHGLGAVRELGLDAYAQRFVAAGLPCLVFDYRGFGASGGEPRQLLDIDRQLEDWAAAIAWARARPDVDPDRVGLWGTSFGGGHVIVTAARDRRIAATVSQCPFTNGLASSLTLGVLSSIKVTWLALLDLLAHLLGRPAVRVKLVGAPGSAALMTAPDAVPGYLALCPPGLQIEEEVAARIALQIPLRSPGRALKDVRSPLMLCVCESDSVAPAGPTLRYARGAPAVDLRVYPVGHFDIYRGAPFEAAVADQAGFLARHLLG